MSDQPPNQQHDCPKCGRVTENPEVCDACGALIGRIRTREANIASMAEEPAEWHSATPINTTPPPRSTLTTLALIGCAVVMTAGAYLYYTYEPPAPDHVSAMTHSEVVSTAT